MGSRMPSCILPHSYIFPGSGSPMPTAHEKPDSPGSPSPPSPPLPELGLLAAWRLRHTRGGDLAWPGDGPRSRTMSSRLSADKKVPTEPPGPGLTCWGFGAWCWGPPPQGQWLLGPR